MAVSVFGGRRGLVAELRSRGAKALSEGREGEAGRWTGATSISLSTVSPVLGIGFNF